ncbi:MAG TPA: anhydro-N-acetylmuramic acid kinase [Fulvivirga sp.]|nr:anhydro-N-acetylmuramic acid kinase [Fulvivirga sp.]
MKKKSVYHVIGLMSGTSLDGLDLAYCKFKKGGESWTFELLDAKTISYPSETIDLLSRSTVLSGLDLSNLDVLLGKWYSKQVNAFKGERVVDFIASHGHTVFHQPENGLTLQIGNGHQIYAETGIPIICDFRSMDVALGGQGAPLVPVGDKYLFSNMDFCLNLGGIANVSFDDTLGVRRAFDIAPCNMLLNYLANKNGQLYDTDGKLAASGQPIPSLLDKWNSLGYYQLGYPKSLGYEWVHKHYFDGLNVSNYKLEDLIHTSVRHIAQQIAASIIQNKLDSNTSLLVTGGGAKNSYLMSCLKTSLNGEVGIIIPEDDIIDYKEAIVFAFLGVLKINNLPNCLASVTGAKQNSSSGVQIGF